MREEYFRWLYGVVCGGSSCDSTYYTVLSILYNREFYSLVPNDENREMDALALRVEFLGFADDERPEPWLGFCSVLEMLVALSDRMVGLFIDTEFDGPPDRWFWEMLDNLGLTYYNDFRFTEESDLFVVHDIINTLLERTYDTDGLGGLFPLKSPPVDQRMVEISYQMESYAQEKLDSVL